MKFLRLLLFPFAIIYDLVTAIRNYFYDKSIYTSHTFPLPVIAVGNLSTGGTGKTPQTEHLIRLLADKYNLATLSRGYGRKTRGFILANETASAQTIGDEPFQFFTKFKSIRVAVDANRVEGMEHLLSLSPKPEVILLDDAYQHRRLKAGFYILLTAYGDLYADDYILPAGNLREGRYAAARANIIIVTKCPPGLAETEQQKITARLRPKQWQQVYFTCIAYDNFVHSGNGKREVAEVRNTQKVLVAGIAKPQPFYDYLAGADDVIKTYPDHHEFTAAEINELDTLAKNRIIVTTEKDYMRLQGRLPDNRLYYLPIQSRFLNRGNDFDKTILNYVGKSTTNR
ncbi:tetraacyldisaccharide 4'-kinase [Flavobacterium sp. RHBU_24]|uniref:tetraacyldisaccharide 4'-kinase n=1 Tax=Flavobacterium sp. RHBU_24 TaxID=3391185 RepID=UPI0039849965